MDLTPIPCAYYYFMLTMCARVSHRFLLAGYVVSEWGTMNAEGHNWLQGAEVEAVFRRMVQGSPCPVIISRLRDGLMFDVSDRFVEVCGYSREELVGQSAITLGLWALPEERLKLKTRLEAGEPVRNTTIHCKTKSGKILLLRASIDFIAGAAEPTIITQAEDITESSRLARELEGGAQRWRATFDAIADMIVIVDRNHKIVDANRVLREMTEDEEVIGRQYNEVMKTRFPALANCCPTETFSQGAPTHIEVREPDGQGRWFDVYAYAIIGEVGQVKQVVHVIRDVTERKNLENQLRHATKMEAVGRLAGGVAHDFNNLLTAITGYSELALSRLEPDNPIYAEIVEVQKAGERAVALTSQLLAFSRRQALQPANANLNELLEDMIKIVGHMVGENIVLEFVPGEQLSKIKADPVQLQQVIINLAVNAREAMPEGGELTISTSNCDFSEPRANGPYEIPPGSYVALTVRDIGMGMDERTVARMFEPFYTTKQAKNGAGLGLATVYGIIKQNNAHIGVESAVNEGTAITIYFPRQDVSDRFGDARARANALRGTETILLVEDEAAVRKLAAMILQSHGYRVIEAEDGVEALRICRLQQDPIHLLLSDVVLPRVSGPSVAERMVDFKPEIKVLFMSGYTEESTLLKSILNHNAAFLPKPFTAESLLLKVRETLDSPAPPAP